jgi:hypothetical protein
VPSLTGRRGWLIRFLLLEKTLQHIFITWVFATDRFDLRQGVVLDYRLFLYSGGVVAVLFLVALLAHLAGRRWALTLAGGLALFDILGEFVAQGGLVIRIVVSFLVAVLLLSR